MDVGRRKSEELGYMMSQPMCATSTNLTVLKAFDGPLATLILVSTVSLLVRRVFCSLKLGEVRRKGSFLLNPCRATHPVLRPRV